MSTLDVLTCQLEGCGARFLRATTGSPARYCSKPCRSRAYYLEHQAPHRKRRTKMDPEAFAEHRRAYTRDYRRRARAAGRLAEYEYHYNRRPEVRERGRMRWHDPVYRERQYALRRVPQVEPLPMLYTGHRWLEMARDAVGRVDPDFADYGYNDDVGEALLALLEGRDMKQALREWRKREFIPRYRTVFWSEYHDDEDQEWKEDRHMPVTPSAEEEAIARETVTTLYLKTRYHHGRNGRPMRGGRKTNQPTRRRMRDAGLREHRRGGVAA